ncbi:ABC transporter substrate-binding protein [Cohnella abietis]|uniref:Fe/B12 periplasmic-binding domain-containing protein n=1 Tax=Cohnella abietis TaxID=2507935 RepID=A0A3T1CXX1_9BACL|nr:ABC transporter substrate-binding protein [Cohnella abietis]BBI30717.1 hypothetical protein KCTCHS21_01160 [Cohnella abietis]
MPAIRKLSSITVIALFMLAILSACGNDNSSNSGGTASAPSTIEPSATVPSSPSSEAQVPEPTTRTVSTLKGDVEIPTHPKRIVALYYHHLLLALGEKPVGANLTWWGGSPYLSEAEASIIDVGGPPSLEAVAQLDPDLIIMNDNNAEDYEQFAKIAPSVLIPYDGNRSAYGDAELIAELLGKPEAAKKLAADFEEHAAAARAKLDGIINPKAKVAIIRIDANGGQFSVFGDNYGRGGWSIYKGLQLQYPDKVKEAVIDSGKQILQELSLEQLPDFVADADYILVSNEGLGLDAIKNNSIWKSIPAVKANHAIELDGKQYFYFDPISVSGQLDHIVDMFLNIK